MGDWDIELSDLSPWHMRGPEASPLLGGGGFGGRFRAFSAFDSGDQTQQERGCLSFTNAIAIVPQDRYYAVEKFGKYTELLPPGLAFVGLDCLGCCISFRSITSRVTQVTVDVKTKTKDHVFVTAKIAVQKSVIPLSAADAMYKLGDVHSQVESYVSDVVRSQIPQMTLCELYENKDTVSDAVLRHLHVEMREFGFEIHRALVVDLTPDHDVMHAMNEISVQKYHRDATFMEAEASQIRTVRHAEAEADAMALNGEGTARQRRAIIEGLRKAVEEGAADREMTQEEISNLLVITQYFETLREIADRSGGQLVFMPHSVDAVADQLAQVVEAMGNATGGKPQDAIKPVQEEMK